MTILDNVQIQLRHDTAANWASSNPVLAEGEVGVEIDTAQAKVGDGSTAYNSLTYVGASGGLTATPPLDITLGVISIPAADTSTDGYLTSADWNTFSGKEEVLTFNAPLSRTTNTISIPAADTSTNGYLTSTDWNTFNGKGSGSVTSVALTVPAILSVSGSPVTTTGTLAVTLATQSANLVWAGPTTGSAAAPTFRSLVSADIPALSYVTSVALTVPSILSVSGSPITSTGTLAVTLATEVANKVFAGPTTGADAPPTFRSLVSGDIPALAYVTSVAITMPSDFSVSGSPITSSGTLAITYATQTANTVLAGPTTGSAATPTYRALVAADIPSLSATYLPLAGGTLTGALLFSTDNTLDIGASGATRPRSIYVGTQFLGVDGSKTAPGFSFSGSTNHGMFRSGGNLLFATSGTSAFACDSSGLYVKSGDKIGFTSSSTDPSASADTFFIRESAAVVQLGIDAGSPIAQTLKGPDARAGTDTNVAGGNLTIAAGRNTGSAVGGSLLFQTAPAGSSGSTAGTLTTRLTITGDNKFGFFGATAVVQQTSGANLTNNVTSGGTDDTIANFTDLTIYANDAAAIRNDIYQLSRKLKQLNDGLRSLGFFT